jgi:hypothetical protein
MPNRILSKERFTGCRSEASHLQYAMQHMCMHRVAAPYAKQALICEMCAEQAMPATRCGKATAGSFPSIYLQEAAEAKHRCQ